MLGVKECMCFNFIALHEFKIRFTLLKITLLNLQCCMLFFCKSFYLVVHQPEYLSAEENKNSLYRTPLYTFQIQTRLNVSGNSTYYLLAYESKLFSQIKGAQETAHTKLRSTLFTTMKPKLTVALVSRLFSLGSPVKCFSAEASAAVASLSAYRPSQTILPALLHLVYALNLFRGHWKKTSSLNASCLCAKNSSGHCLWQAILAALSHLAYEPNLFCDIGSIGSRSSACSILGSQKQYLALLYCSASSC